MSFFRVALVAGATLLATLFSSAAFAGCCGGCGGCGGYVMTYAPPPPVVFVPAPVEYAVPAPVPPPVAPLAIAPVPIAVDHWDTGGWGGCCNSWGGCGCNRGFFGGSGFFGSPGPAPIYIVNQGPQYSGPGIMIPSLSYSPSEGIAAPGAYPYIGHYPPYVRYAHGVHRYYWHHRHPLHTRG